MPYNDKEIQLISLQDDFFKSIKINHESSINCLAIEDELIVGGFEDGSLLILNQDSDSTKKIQASNVSIESVCISGGKIYSGSKIGEIKKWQGESGEEFSEKTNLNFKSNQYCDSIIDLKIFDNILYSRSWDGHIRIWHSNTGNLLNSFEIDLPLELEGFGKLVVGQGKIITMSGYDTIKVHDFNPLIKV